ncbi:MULTISPECIES: DUF1540 domain-containing protein [Caproicibacterium]|uniref:DUF1540 domain-containing protein n=1 Tax=Caproicibacterium argilliputei TaxID=3030016 RepID=A0AA97D8M6_9FIRM|nr:DUF1540 domain-containing protein [Caproicibacterium argilliputei]WOC31707.1 DUF1540 domain-containing protein [Caproicibacterium argilliputei]
MTNLKCSVTECINNSSRNCCRPDIMVGGKSACGCEQTCCADFEQKSGSDSAQNSCGCSSPNPQLHIRCEAEKCIYNQQGECSADDVAVRGSNCQNATCKSETECGTFKMR